MLADDTDDIPWPPRWSMGRWVDGMFEVRPDEIVGSMRHRENWAMICELKGL